ncbi:PREDICTED: protein RNA-directed DNA methylation 3 [Prunus mume]|uniref:Protein RNA-directed DNA methylation 3 n=1 Tax=Prunus mume TaxID=102107 RepID=A0ABM0P2G1_PRUMU|nr:PREDICTED: protein RNA-directed DNA methylation 3 [Prunus mume]
MTSKGKGIAGGGSSGGKRKYDDDKTGGGRKRTDRGVLKFFEDVAAEADDGDDSDFDDDFMEEEFETEPVVKNEPGKAHNLPFIPKEEDVDGEEFEKMMEERYRSGSSYITYAEDNYENKRSVDGSVLLPTVKDPIIWKVKCMVGRERHSAFCMMQKFVDLRSLGTKLEIISAFAVEHIKGFLFIEADKQSDINEACKGICSIYSSRVMPVPNNEVSHLLSPRTRYNGITVGMWARVKSGNYKGDLAQVVFMNDLRKRATVKLIPRINLQAMAAKFGGGGTRKKVPAPAPRLINSSELEEFRPLIQCRKDRESGMRFEFLDGLMFKDGYLYKKVPIDSLSFWGVMPSEEELLKFKSSENNEGDNLEWLTELYGKEKKRRTIKIEEGGGKGEGSSGCMGKGEGSSGSMGKGEGSSGCMGKGEGSSGSMGKGESASGSMGKGEGSSGSMGKGEGSSGSMGKGEGSLGSVGKGVGSSGSGGNCFELYDLVCLGRKDFGLVIGMEKDDSYKILKEGLEGPVVLIVQKRELKNVLSDMKFTALDRRTKPICVSDTVKVLEGPLKDRQGIVRQIYRGTIFLYDENETENGGYFCSKSHMCEKIKLYNDACKEKDGDSGGPGFEDFMSSPKSPLSPKKPWLERDSNFNRGDTDGIFSIGQTVRIRVGPLKGYLCRILAIRRADITVKLDSQQKVLTVKCEHLSEVRGKSSSVLISEDPESSLKPFDMLGNEGGSKDWTDGAGASAGGAGNGWNAGGVSGERNSWPSFSATGISIQSESISGQDGNDVKKDDSWESKVAPNKISSWGAATDNNDQGAGWGKGVDSWGKSSAKTGGDSSASDIWQKAIEPSGTATAGNSQLDSWGKGKNVVESGSWEKNSDATSGDIASSGWGQQKPLDKGNAVSSDGSDWGKAQNKGAGWGTKEDSCSKATGNWSTKDESSAGEAGWKISKPAEDVQTGSWGNAGGVLPQSEAGNEDEASGWAKPKGAFSNENQNDSWKKPSGVDDNKRASWGKADGGSAWNKQDGDSTWNKQGEGSTWNKQDGGSAWNKPAGDSSWSKQAGGSSWGKQADVTAGHESGGVGNQDDGWKRAKSFGGDQGSGGWGKGSGDKGDIDQQDFSGRPKSFEGAHGFGGRRGGRGGRDQFGRGRSFSQDQSSGWNKDRENNRSADGIGGWKNPNASVENNGSGWSKGWGGDWNAPKSSDRDQMSGWGQTKAWQSGSSDGGNQVSSWGQKGSWNSRSSEAGGNQDSSSGGKRDWNIGSDSSGGNQDSTWGKKSNWNSGSGDTGGNKDSGWGRKNSWNSGSGDADQNSNWSSKSNWNSANSFGGSQSIDGGNGDQPEDFNNNRSGGNWRGGSGRGNSDRGGFRGGRGFGCGGGEREGDRGGFGRRGGFGGRGGDRGSFGGRGRSDRGGFGGRGGSDGGGFGGTGGSDGGGFGGTDGSDGGGFGGTGYGGRGRGRDQSGGWSNRNDSFDNNSSGWSKGADGAGEGWKKDNGGGSWNQGGGSKNDWQGGKSSGWISQSSGWNQSDVNKGIGGSGSGWNQTVEAKDTAATQDKGTGSRNEASGSWANNWKSSDACNVDQLSSWKQSTAAKEVKGTTDQDGGWNKGPSSSTQAGGWGNQGSGWNKGTGSGFGGGTGGQPSAAGGGKSSDWKQSSTSSGAQSSGWNQSGEAKQGTDQGAVPTNSWGKAAAACSWGNGSDGGEAKQGTDEGAKPTNSWGKAVAPASSWGKGSDGGSGKGGW